VKGNIYSPFGNYNEQWIDVGHKYLEYIPLLDLRPYSYPNIILKYLKSNKQLHLRYPLTNTCSLLIPKGRWHFWAGCCECNIFENFLKLFEAIDMDGSSPMRRSM
jgi:hypothetical protein